MKKYIQKMNPMFRSLLLGTVAYGILVGIVLCVLLRKYLPEVFTAGLFGYVCGVFYAIIQLVHMYYGILVTLDYREEKSAAWHSRKMYAVRLLVIFIIFFIVWCVGRTYGLVFTVPGMASLKVAAYLQPFTDKFIHAVFREETANK